MKKIFLPFLFFLFVVAVFPQSPVELLFKNTPELIFKFQAKDKGQINELTRRISIDNVQGNEVTAYANREEFEYFLTLNIPYEIIQKPVLSPEELNMKSFEKILYDRTVWNYYPTYEAYLSLMSEFEANYPELCQVIDIGQTVQNRKLLACKLSKNVSVREAEPQFFWSSSMHGDETTGYVLMLRFIDYLLKNYGRDEQVTNLLDNMEIWITPLANPDGTFRTGNSSVSGSIRYNANYKDLNRNYKDWKYGDHPDNSAWQPETNAFVAFQGNQSFVMSANIHGGAEVCNYVWDNSYTRHADDAWWKYICKEYADTAKYYGTQVYMTSVTNSGVTNGYDWYQITGSRQDYANYYNHCREFTLEISNTKNPPASQLPNFWDYNYRSFLNCTEQCLFGIHGIVTDSLTKAPLSAQIFVNNHDKDGSFVLTDYRNGFYARPIKGDTYSVTYSADGYISQTKEITLTDRQKTVCDVALVPMIPPIADFEADTTEIFVNDTVRFVDLSQLQESLEWYFEGGTPEISTEQNPMVVYETEGVFDVSLTVGNDNGSDEIIKEKYITVVLPVVTGKLNEISSSKVHWRSVNNGKEIQIHADENIRTIEIFDRSGREIKTLHPNAQICVFPVTDIITGTYPAKVKTENGITVLKIQVQ